uniref:Uncharacterized protein n=1 Tax=Leersia perrieri TaxID=77586 RepID=A0A0D9XT75_9ORYZ
MVLVACRCHGPGSTPPPSLLQRQLLHKQPTSSHRRRRRHLLTPASMADEDVAPRTASAYLDPSYWDERFGKEEHYEWFKDFSHFRHLLAPLISPSTSVLEVGCGNSRLGEELLREGVAGGITCVDLSPVAVQRMRDRLAEQGTEGRVFTGLVNVNLKAVVSFMILINDQWSLLFGILGVKCCPLLLAGVEVVVADMLDLPFERESFDLVVEKGTMDVLFVDSGDPWNPNPDTVDNVMKMLEGIHKVLKPEGIFVSITFGQPHFRRRFFEAPEFTWSVEWSTFGDGFHYFFYILKKGKRSLDSIADQHTQPTTPSINMFHEELESEDYIFRTNVDEL